MRLGDAAAYSRALGSSRPGQPVPWTLECEGAWAPQPRELERARGRRAHHLLVVGGVLVGAVSALLPALRGEA